MLMDNEDTSEKSPDKNFGLSFKQGIWITFIAGVIIVCMVTVIVPRIFHTPYYSRNYDSDAKSNLHNVFLACKAYWADNGSGNNCTPEIFSQAEYGYIQSADVNVSGSGAETAFSATAGNLNSKKTFSIDFNGTITEVD